MKKLFYSFLIVALSQIPAGAISLNEAIEEALNNNPDIKTAKAEYESANAKIPQAMSPDDPWIIYRPNAQMDIRDPSIEISQEIPFPTKLFTKGRIAGSEAKSKYEAYKEKERDVLAKVKTVYAELYLAGKMLEVNGEIKGLVGQITDSATNRYSLSKSGQQDVLKAQVELAKVEGNLITWQQKKQTANAKLNILLNRDPESELGDPVITKDLNLIHSLSELYASAKENRPELRSLRYLIDAARDSVNLAGQEYLPDFMVSYERMTDSSDDMWMFGASIPFWFFIKQNYGIKEMKSDLAMAEYEYKNMENVVLFEIKDFFTQVDANKKLRNLYETSLMPQADQSFKASITAYESGQADFLSLLDSERGLLDIKMDYYEILVNLEIAIAELEKAVGIDLKEVAK